MDGIVPVERDLDAVEAVSADPFDPADPHLGAGLQAPGLGLLPERHQNAAPVGSPQPRVFQNLAECLAERELADLDARGHGGVHDLGQLRLRDPFPRECVPEGADRADQGARARDGLLPVEPYRHLLMKVGSSSSLTLPPRARMTIGGAASRLSAAGA